MHRRIPVLLTLALIVLLDLGATPARASAAALSRLVDPDTSASWEDALGGEALSTADAGRIWVDKSVYDSSGAARAAGLPVGGELGDHGFLVGLSAISSAASVRREGGPAHDVVLVVSTNQLLRDLTYGDRPQVEYLVDALNGAIGRLMAENDGAAVPTRVSVIGYDAQVTTLMPLDVWEPGADGRYVGYADGALTVTATARGGSQSQSVPLGSGSYLQLATHVAGEELVGAADDAGSEGREPVLLLMGLETPPMASADFTDPPAYGSTDPAALLGPLPNSRENGYGTDALLATLLTMRYEAQRVGAAWGEGRPLALFTCGLDTSETAAFLLETAHEQAYHPLPGSGAAAGTDLRDNLSAAVRALAEASEEGEKDVTLRLFGSSARGLVAEDVTFPVVPGLLSAEDGFAITPVDDYLSARSAAALSWALGTVVDRSLGVSYTAPASGGPDDGRPGGSRVTVSDPLGAGMVVSRMDGLVYGDRLLDGALAAQAVEISLEDPTDVEATHEFAYLVEAVNHRYDLGYAAYDLFYDALRDGQFSYAGPGDFSNRASWYVDDAHEMVRQGSSRPYWFATQAEVDAVADGSWETRADADVRSRIEAARDAGATAVCETYFYIGNLPNQYTGGDVALYDFVVMVETRLDTGRQTVLLSVPVEAVPAVRASVTVAADGSATMARDDGGALPLRLAYEVSPAPDVEALLERMEAGELVSDDELTAALGEPVARWGVSGRALYASAFDGSGAGTVAAAWAAQGNAQFAFALDTPLYVRGTSGYEPLASLPAPGQTCYYERVAYTADAPATGEAVPAAAERAWESWTVGLTESGIRAHLALEDGQCVALAGTPRYAAGADLGTDEKDPNVTGSAPYAKSSSVAEVSGDAVRLRARLGNNGVLVLPGGVETGSLAVEKHVEGDPTDGGFRFTITLADADGAPLSGDVTYRVGDVASTVALDGSGSFSAELSDGERLEVDGLPRGTRYIVREDDYSGAGYVMSAEGDEGTIGDEPAVARFTNTFEGAAVEPEPTPEPDPEPKPGPGNDLAPSPDQLPAAGDSAPSAGLLAALTACGVALVLLALRRRGRR